MRLVWTVLLLMVAEQLAWSNPMTDVLKQTCAALRQNEISAESLAAQLGTIVDRPLPNHIVVKPAENAFKEIEILIRDGDVASVEFTPQEPFPLKALAVFGKPDVRWERHPGYKNALYRAQRGDKFESSLRAVIDSKTGLVESISVERDVRSRR